MVRHFFLDKTNTIVEYSKQNLGLNPVMHIAYGDITMRGLLHFDICKIKELIEDKTFADTDKLKFTLKMTNYFSIDGLPYEKPLVKSFPGGAQRAASFDLILFKLPCDFDEGRGFDFMSDFWVRNNRSVSTNGSNWYFAKNEIPWNYERDDEKPVEELVSPKIFNKSEFLQLYDKLMKYSKQMGDENVEPTCEEIIEDIKSIKTNYKYSEDSLKGGVYSLATIEAEYEKFINGEDSIIVAEQHFDFGNENLSMDITSYVFECLESGENNGLCLAFSPMFENTNPEIEQYVGFVDDNTNTFFHPYIEIDYSNYIKDDREAFTLGRTNNLYLYVYDDGVPANLDKNPVCTVGDVAVESKQVSKGVYCAEIDARTMEMEPAAIYYDNWSEIELNGDSEEDIELEFSTRPKSYKLKAGSDSSVKQYVVPSVYGINDDEKVHQGEVREVVVDFRKEYETEKKLLVDGATWRLYTKDGNREVTVIDYQPVEKAFLNNFFMIYAEDLIPGRYYVDIVVKIGRETKYFKEALRFKVVSDVTERYQ